MYNTYYVDFKFFGCLIGSSRQFNFLPFSVSAIQKSPFHIFF